MLKVHVENTPVGNLVRSDMERGKFYFSYDSQCLPHNAVSLTMPVINDPYPFNYRHQLHPIFDMNLPEGELGKRLRQQFSKAVPNFDDLTLLKIVGKFQIGRLRFVQAGEIFTDTPAHSLAELIKHDGAEGLFESLLDRYAVYSGISGVQPKVMLRDSASPNIGRVTHRDATHIVKAWTSEHPYLAANEFFCLRAAHYSGIDVPSFRLSDHGKFLIVERFDLDLNNDIYFGFEDFCVLNGKTSEQKYDGSYEGVAKRVKEFVTPKQIPAALESYFKILALSCVVKNGDAHLKNFGVLYDNTEGHIRLSPAYDIITTTAYNPNDSLALTLGGSKRWPKAKQLTNFACQHCGMTEKNANEQIGKIYQGVEKATVEVTDYIKHNGSFQEIGSKMLMEWAKGLELSAKIR
jgi:serine/threonine-protein kinase HipA